MTDCLDSWAILRWLEGEEPAATRVDAALLSRPVMSWINLGEVFYIAYRATGAASAKDVVRDLRPRIALDLPSESRVLEAATIKAQYRMAYADAFAVATAKAHNAVLLTGNPEILDADCGWLMEDLRPTAAC